MKRWVGFDAEQETPAGTSVGYRLVVTAGDLYWDGAAWSAASSDAHWNTVEEVAANIAAFQPTDFELAFRLNLRSNGTATPKVRRLKILVEALLADVDDLIYDTVIASLRSSLRATTALEFAAGAGTQVIDLANLGENPAGNTQKLDQSGYNFVDVVAAYNLTDDPNALVPLAATYTPGAVREDGTAGYGTVDLGAPLAADAIVRILMEHAPEVAVFTDQDYYDIKKIPAVVFERIASTRPQAGTDQEANDADGEVVRNLVEGVGIMEPRPIQATFVFEFAVLANGLDHASVIDSMTNWIRANRLLRTAGLDEEVGLVPQGRLDTDPRVDREDVTVSVGSFRVTGVPLRTRDCVEVGLVTDVNLTIEG